MQIVHVAVHIPMYTFKWMGALCKTESTEAQSCELEKRDRSRIRTLHSKPKSVTLTPVLTIVQLFYM